MERAFKGVWIPREIWLSKELTLQEKIFLVEINSLDNENGCFASNAYFAEFFQLSKNRCSEVIKSLENKNLISVKYIREDGKKNIEKRVIRVIDKPKSGIRETDRPIRKVEEGYSENCEDNNTVFNTTFNNTKDIKPSSRKQVYDKDSVHYQLALRLYENILKNNPDHKKPNLHTWANDIRLMMERDNRTAEKIAYLMDWVQNDSFWKSNILSVSKLREKYDQLVLRVKEDIAKRNKSTEKQIPKAYQSLQDWADEVGP